MKFMSHISSDTKPGSPSPFGVRGERGSGGLPEHACSRFAYLRAVETLPKTTFSDVPSAPTTVMIATEMPAAMRPYSMAVAPELVLKKRRYKIFHGKVLWF